MQFSAILSLAVFVAGFVSAAPAVAPTKNVVQAANAAYGTCETACDAADAACKIAAPEGAAACDLAAQGCKILCGVIGNLNVETTA